jgi:hypothetical protein
VTTYSLRYREVGSDEAGWSQPVVVDGTSHALTGLAPGVRYDVEVTAVSGASQSLATVGQRSTRCAAPSEPSALPAGYALSTDDPGTNGRLAVSWTEVTGAVSYEVRARTGAAAFTAVGDPVAGLATTLTGLDGAQSFDVEVMAVNVDGDRSVASTARTGVPAGIASGGDVTAFTADGSNGTAGTTYVVHRFATVGSESFTLHRDRTVEYLIVAGGGGGSRSGGGGAGGLRSGSTALTAGAARTIAVGGGGAGSSSSDAANDGGNSSALGLTASGGGGGGANAFAGAGRAGGSGGGGGAAAGGHVNAGGAGTTGQGRNGGSSYGFLSFPGGWRRWRRWRGRHRGQRRHRAGDGRSRWPRARLLHHRDADRLRGRRRGLPLPVQLHRLTRCRAAGVRRREWRDRRVQLGLEHGRRRRCRWEGRRRWRGTVEPHRWQRRLGRGDHPLRPARLSRPAAQDPGPQSRRTAAIAARSTTAPATSGTPKLATLLRTWQ